VVAQDKAALARASGVGPRLAARIVAELRDRLDDLPPSPLHPAVALPVAAGALDEALSALVNLGYGRSEAHAALARAARGLGEQPDFEQLVRAALQELASA
jgi:holliday junction DNA helicase RuvA